MQISSVHNKTEMPKQNGAEQSSTISMATQLQPTLTTYSTLNNFKQSSQTMAFALLAILGQRSAHSFPTGPVIADPFISPLGLTITPALSAMQDVINKIRFSQRNCHATAMQIRSYYHHRDVFRHVDNVQTKNVIHSQDIITSLKHNYA
jgi:hypothetical protein